MSNDPKHDIEMKWLPIDDCEPNSWNSQTMDEKTFDRLKQEIAEVGFNVPIQVVPVESGKYRIIGGEHRWKAAKSIGMNEIPASILVGKKWDDTDLQKFVTVRLNALSGKLNPEKFAMLYTEMAEKYGAESLSGLMGFTDQQAFAKALGGVKKGLKKALPPSMHAAVDAATKEAKSVQDLGNIIQLLFSQYGDTVQMSFMVFTYGKQDHLYISMDKDTKKAMGKVCDYCRATGQDINSVIAPILQKGAKELAESIPAKKKSNKPGDGEAEF